VTDGWSQNIFVRELTVLYDAYSNNCPSPLPELPVQYADFAAWQRKWLQGQVLEGLLEYWKTNLAGPLELLNFPTDYPRRKRSSYRGSCVVWQHSQQQLAQLKQLGRSEGVTLFMTLLPPTMFFFIAIPARMTLLSGPISPIETILRPKA